MKVQVGVGELIKPCSYTFKIICFYLLFLASITSSLNTTKCPFQYVYHFGDGITDIGNSINVLPWEPVPARHSPYGITFPGWPTGRWSDGYIDFDYTAIDFGLPKIVPYLTLGASTSYDGVIFSVARSPVLSHQFFKSKGIHIAPYAVPLNGQISWFKKYLKSICSTPQDCAKRLKNSLILMGDIEGNDIGYSLTQGKSIQEVQTYVPLIIRTVISASKELIRLGATRVIIPGNGPLGCYPYILTELYTTDSTAYDDLGCLKSVNDFIVSKNHDLRQAVINLRKEFPDVVIYFGDMYDGVRSIINQTSVIGIDGNKALKSCCGIGGLYNYDSRRFCGSPGVPVCSNPNEYIYWDGLHFTQQAYYRIEHLLVQQALVDLNCTSSLLSYGVSSRSMSS
ncbi:hypothetical protein Pfo_026991 [Paulownia fortunei]|nr:hypothetical protein Pfo_026991 [Paulownia fortunei]